MIEQQLSRIGALHQALPAGEIIALYTALAEQSPQEPRIWQSLALYLMLQGDYAAAVTAIDRALALKKDAVSFFIKGRACDELLDYPRSIESYRQCLGRDKANTKAKFYLSLAYLSLGDFANGTAFYPARLKPEEVARTAGIKRWTPDERRGRVLIWAEQGIGDEVMFYQLLHLVDPAAFAFTIECDRRMIALFSANFPGFTFVARDGAHDRRAFDYQLPMGGLLALFHPPLLAGEVRRPAMVPLPHPDIAARAAALKADRRLVGISWFSASEDYGARRSVPLETLIKNLDPARHALAILQYLPPEEDIAALRARGFTCIADVDTFNDIEATLALIAACDTILTIDNSVAHFAGALGADTHLLLPELPNWRWGVTGESSYWYPGLRLHRRTQGLDWADVVDAITVD